MSSPFAAAAAEPRDDSPRLTPLKYGTLPTRSFLAPRCDGVTVDDALNALRDLVRRGEMETARRFLNMLGFDWLPSKAQCPTCGVVGECMCADVEAVRDDMPEDCAVCASLQLQLEQMRAELDALRAVVPMCRATVCANPVGEWGALCSACHGENYGEAP